MIPIKHIRSAYRGGRTSDLSYVAALIYVRANQIQDSLPLSAKRSHRHSMAYIKAMQIRNSLMSLAVRMNEDDSEWNKFWNEVEKLESEESRHESR